MRGAIWLQGTFWTLAPHSTPVRAGTRQTASLERWMAGRQGSCPEQSQKQGLGDTSILDNPGQRRDCPQLAPGTHNLF